MVRLLVFFTLVGCGYWIHDHPESQAAQSVNQAWGMVKAEWASLTNEVRNGASGGIRLNGTPMVGHK